MRMLSPELMLSLHCTLYCNTCLQSDEDASDDEGMGLLNTKEMEKRARKASKASKAAAAAATAAAAGRQQAASRYPEPLNQSSAAQQQHPRSCQVSRLLIHYRKCHLAAAPSCCSDQLQPSYCYLSGCCRSKCCRSTAWQAARFKEQLITAGIQATP
jgi:hypothetical protein